MQVLATGGCDAERLLHETVWLVTVSIWTLAFRVTIRGALGRLAARPLDKRWRWCSAASLSFHFAICQEAARHATSTPGFSICPPPHACLALIPYEH